MPEIIAGIDEAGRGAVIGPLVIAGVSINSEDEMKLRKHGVKDSKELAHRRRERLAKFIEKVAKDIVIIKLSACKIDNYRKEGINLNKLEAIKFADIVNYLDPQKAFIDSPDVNTERLGLFLKKMIKNDNKLIVEHFADKKYPAVSAASIIAKVVREEDLKELKKKYGDFGPGYPSNPITIQWMKSWLEKNKEFPDIVRKSWATTKQIMGDKSQRKLFGWFKKDEECKK